MSTRAWSEEDEKELIIKYENHTTDPHELGDYFSKGYRSVISKLVQLKIYKKPEDEVENKGKTVKMMLRDLEIMLDIKLDGASPNLNKKQNLQMLVEAIEQIMEEK